MKKLLLSLTAMLLSFSGAFAQIIMGGYTSDSYSTSGLGVGSYATGTLGAYSYLPVSAIPAFDGAKVVKMRVSLAQSTSISHVYILPVVGGYIQNAIVSEDVRGKNVGWNEFTLSTPVTLDLSSYDAILMGYDYNQTSTNYPISAVNEGSGSYDMYVYGNLGQGTGYYSFGSSYGNLSIQAIVEGDFAQNAAEPLAHSAFIVPFGGSSEQTFSLQNMGEAKINTISYVLSIDGQESAEKQASLNGVAFGENGYFKLNFNSADTEKTQHYELTITKVNGEENAAATKSISGVFASTSRQITKNVTVEEYTGTGCGWCPRGYIGMEMLRKAYGDRFVGIAVHQYNTSDAMFIPLNNYASINFDGAPECSVDRMGLTDPYYGDTNEAFGIHYTFDYLASIPALVGATVTGEWNEDTTQVTATAVIEGIIDGDKYNVEFVLIGDSLTGTTSAWNQSNYYYQYTSSQVDADLALFASGGKYGTSSVRGLYFNDVALSSSYVGGVNQAGQVTIDAAEPAVVSYTLSLPSSSVLRNAINTHNLYVAVLLVNTLDGSIANSAKVQVPFFTNTATGITPAEVQSQTEQSRFAADGRLLQAPQRGLNIVRMADGSVRKVIVR